MGLEIRLGNQSERGNKMKKKLEIIVASILCVMFLSCDVMDIFNNDDQDTDSIVDPLPLVEKDYNFVIDTSKMSEDVVLYDSEKILGIVEKGVLKYKTKIETDDGEEHIIKIFKLSDITDFDNPDFEKCFRSWTTVLSNTNAPRLLRLAEEDTNIELFSVEIRNPASSVYSINILDGLNGEVILSLAPGDIYHISQGAGSLDWLIEYWTSNSSDAEDKVISATNVSTDAFGNEIFDVVLSEHYRKATIILPLRPLDVIPDAVGYLRVVNMMSSSIMVWTQNNPIEHIAQNDGIIDYISNINPNGASATFHIHSGNHPIQIKRRTGEDILSENINIMPGVETLLTVYGEYDYTVEETQVKVTLGEVTSTKVDINWDGISGFENYTLDISTDEFFEDILYSKIKIYSDNYQLDMSDFELGIEYYVRVRANIANAGGFTRWSETVSFIYEVKQEETIIEELSVDPIIELLFSNEVKDSRDNAEVTGVNCEFTSDRYGVANSALLLNQELAHVAFGNEQILKKQNFSISLWIKTTDKLGGILFSNNSIYDYDQSIYLCSEFGSFDFHFYCRSELTFNGSVLLNDEIDTNDGEWHHIVIVKDNNIGKLYVDNNLVYERSDLYDAIHYYENDDFRLGGCGDADPTYFNGVIDDFKYFTEPLNPSDVNVLFSN